MQRLQIKMLGTLWHAGSEISPEKYPLPPNQKGLTHNEHSAYSSYFLANARTCNEQGKQEAKNILLVCVLPKIICSRLGVHGSERERATTMNGPTGALTTIR